MLHTHHCRYPLGEILLAADDVGFPAGTNPVGIAAQEIEHQPP